MKVFFNTFLRVLASLISILVFVIIIGLLINFSEKNKKNNQFKFVEGIEISENKIAILELNGPIINNLQNFNNLQGFSIISPSLLKEKLNQLNKISPKILIISINSPGGTVSASNEAFDIIEEFKKENNLTIYFHTSETLASGAYWLSLSGDKIFASYGSLIGSIGVKGPDWIFYDKPISIGTGIFGTSIETQNGIKVYSQNAGKSKDLLNPFREPTEEELINLQSMIDDIYNDFVNIVSRKRSLELNFIKNEIGGSLYNSSQAVSHFLIDKEISLDLLIKKIISKNNWDDYKIFQSSNVHSLFLSNLFSKNLQSFKNYSPVINKNLICEQLRSNITSINLNYFSKC